MTQPNFPRVRTTRTGRLGVGVLVALLLVVSVATGTAAAQSAPDCSTVSYNGDGTSVNPHEVSNLDQLQCIEDQGLNLNYRLVSDIDASETAFWNGGDGFEPIGDSPVSGTPFAGTFDGDGHQITDLSINRQTEDTVGLFAVVDTPGTVTNVSVVGATVAGDRDVGVLVGQNDGAVTESSASGDVTATGRVGGLVGGNDGGTVTDSYATGSVSGSSNVGVSNSGGGLVGRNDGTVERSYATGDVSGDVRVGSLVGYNKDATVRESYATGSVSGDRSVGGLVGDNFEGIVEMSYANGSVSGIDRVGGIVGSNDGGTVNESYATGSVSGSGNETGGLVGRNRVGIVEMSYANGSVSGNNRVGGLIGFNDGTISESSASGNATGNKSIGGFVGLNAGTIEDSYARGVVAGFEKNVGGLIGKNGLNSVPGTVRRSYATGEVIGPLFFPGPNPGLGPGPIPDPTLTQDSSTITGGLVGNNSAGTVTDSYWDTETTGQSSSDGGTGLTTDEMTGSAATSNMEGFDFTSTWETVSSDYPILVWQSEDDSDDGGNISPDNPFFDATDSPRTRQEVISRVVQWNLNGEINDTSYTRDEIIGYIVEWNLA